MRSAGACGMGCPAGWSPSTNGTIISLWSLISPKAASGRPTRRCPDEEADTGRAAPPEPEAVAAYIHEQRLYLDPVQGRKGN